MTHTSPLAPKFQKLVPVVLQWIDATIARHAQSAASVDTAKFQRLSMYFPSDVLGRARVVSVSCVPRPPLSQLGMPELKAFEQLHLDGITFRNTFFVDPKRNTESLQFHELVHVVQWERLGPERFLLAYGLGLLGWGYHNHPLERMAYSFQDAFQRGRPIEHLCDQINTQTDAIWVETERKLQA